MSTPTTDDIMALLDAVEDRQIKCPVCGRSDDLYVVYPEFITRHCGATLTGGLVESYVNDDVITPPAHFNIPTRLLICGNFLDHDPDYDPTKPSEAGAPWEWFEYPKDTPWTFDASWNDIQVLRGQAEPEET